MGRKRSTWNDRKADPYTMHQERDLPPVEKYLIGDPSAFAEDVHAELPDDEALGRNEIGLPNMPASNLNHKDVEEWNSGDAYDNASTFSPEDRDRKETPDVPVDQMNDRKVASPTPKQSARSVFAALERKAFNCTKIAQALLPGAPQSLIEEQSYELMALPDEFVIATVLRLAADEEEEKDSGEDKEAGEKHEEEDKEADRKEKAAAILREAQAQARRVLAGDDEDEDDSDDEDEKSEDDSDDSDDDEEKDGGSKKSSLDFSDDQIEAMLREMIAEDKEEEEDAKAEAGMMHREMMDHDAMPMHAGEELHAMDMDISMDMMGDEDPEIDAMLKDMMDHQSMGMDSGMHMHSSTEFDIGMDPRLDVVASETLAGDDTLQNLFNNTIPEEARTAAPVRETAKTAGVQSLGGRVKEAADTEEDYDLSKLWTQAPDISGVY